MDKAIQKPSKPSKPYALVKADRRLRRLRERIRKQKDEEDRKEKETKEAKEKQTRIDAHLATLETQTALLLESELTESDGFVDVMKHAKELDEELSNLAANAAKVQADIEATYDKLEEEIRQRRVAALDAAERIATQKRAEIERRQVDLDAELGVAQEKQRVAQDLLLKTSLVLETADKNCIDIDEEHLKQTIDDVIAARKELFATRQRATKLLAYEMTWGGQRFEFVPYFMSSLPLLCDKFIVTSTLTSNNVTMTGHTFGPHSVSRHLFGPLLGPKTSFEGRFFVRETTSLPETVSNNDLSAWFADPDTRSRHLIDFMKQVKCFLVVSDKSYEVPLWVGFEGDRVKSGYLASENDLFYWRRRGISAASLEFFVNQHMIYKHELTLFLPAEHGEEDNYYEDFYDDDW